MGADSRTGIASEQRLNDFPKHITDQRQEEELRADVPQQGERGCHPIGEVKDQLVSRLGEGPDKPIQEEGNDIEKVKAHKDIDHDGIEQQPISLQRTYAQQIRLLSNRPFPDSPIEVSQQLDGTLPQVRHAQQIGGDPITIEFKEGI